MKRITKKELLNDYLDLKRTYERLEERVKVLEFERDAHGEMYVVHIQHSPWYIFGLDQRCYVKFLHNDKVIECRIGLSMNSRYVTLNKKYIEVRNDSDRELFRVYTADLDKLIEVDLDLYKKVYYPEPTEGDSCEGCSEDCGEVCKDLVRAMTDENGPCTDEMESRTDGDSND